MQPWDGQVVYFGGRRGAPCRNPRGGRCIRRSLRTTRSVKGRRG